MPYLCLMIAPVLLLLLLLWLSKGRAQVQVQLWLQVHVLARKLLLRLPMLL